MESTVKFPGFKSRYRKNFTTLPHELVDRYFGELSGSEVKCLMFILRQTFGFNKVSDKISISQFVTGIGERTAGVGVSKSQVTRCLKTLEQKGYISLKKSPNRTSEISLRLEEETRDSYDESETVNTKNTPSPEIIRLMKLFEPVAGSMVSKYVKSKSQIEALERVVAHHGLARAEEVINYIPKSNGIPYFPSINSPVELEQKFMKLLGAAFRKKKEDESGRFTISI